MASSVVSSWARFLRLGIRSLPVLKEQEMNLVELVDRFHSEERCRKFLEELRWPDGIACPRCGGWRASESLTALCMERGHSSRLVSDDTDATWISLLLVARYWRNARCISGL